MNTVDIIVLAVVCAAAAAVVGWLIWRKLKGKGGCCDCGYKSCPHCDGCHTKNK